MCFGGRKKQEQAANNAAAEAQRQADIERARLAEEARIAKEEADKRYAEELVRQQARDDAARADAEAFKQKLIEQEAFRLSEQQRIEDQRKADRESDLKRADELRNAELARQDKERKDAEAAQAAKAAALTSYNAGRQQLVDSSRGQVEAAFAPFNDQYYSQYENDYVNAQKPKIAQQYDDAKRATTFGFARRGNLESTAAARNFGRLDQTRAEAEADVAQKAKTASGAFRQSTEAQKASLLNSIFGAVNAAPVITVDNVGEANNSLNSLTNALSSPVDFARSAAGSITPPGFGDLGSIFTLPGQAAARPITYGGGSGTSSLSSRGGSSGRLVA